MLASPVAMWAAPLLTLKVVAAAQSEKPGGFVAKSLSEPYMVAYDSSRLKR
jgi:ABC-type sugar transport system substrate-binding protein